MAICTICMQQICKHKEPFKYTGKACGWLGVSQRWRKYGAMSAIYMACLFGGEVGLYCPKVLNLIATLPRGNRCLPFYIGPAEEPYCKGMGGMADPVTYVPLTLINYMIYHNFETNLV